MNNWYLALILILITSCHATETDSIQSTISKNQTKLQEMEWVIGKWEQVTKDGVLYEFWSKVNDSMYSGKSFMISNLDTIFSEKISLVLRNSDLYYIPTVSHQNNSEPVTFKLVSNKSNEMVFENKQHDFPQRIIYSHQTSDSFYARIEGDVNGVFKKEHFCLNRIKSY